MHRVRIYLFLLNRPIDGCVRSLLQMLPKFRIRMTISRLPKRRIRRLWLCTWRIWRWRLRLYAPPRRPLTFRPQLCILRQIPQRRLAVGGASPLRIIAHRRGLLRPSVICLLQMLPKFRIRMTISRLPKRRIRRLWLCGMCRSLSRFMKASTATRIIAHRRGFTTLFAILLSLSYIECMGAPEVGHPTSRD